MNVDDWLDQWTDDNAADDFDVIPDVVVPEVTAADLYCDRCEGVCSCPLDLPPWNDQPTQFPE